MVLFQQTVEAARLLRERRQVGFKTPVKLMKVVFQERCKMLHMQKFQSLFAELLNVVDVDLSECLQDSLGDSVEAGDASVLFVPTLKKKKNCVVKKLKRAKVSAEAVELVLRQVPQTELHKFWQTTLSASKELAGSTAQLTLTLVAAAVVDAETTGDSDSFEESKTTVTLFREDLDVRPELTSDSWDDERCETTLDSSNNLVMLDFTPSEDFTRMAMCRNLVSQVQRMFKRLDVTHPGAGPTAKVRVVVLPTNPGLFHTLSEMREYVVKFLRRDFVLANGSDCGEDTSSSEAKLAQTWEYPEETLAARVELY
jgi:hypothetical protein